MSLCPRRALPALFVLLGACLPARAARGVEDDAHLFSHATREKASDAIEEVYRRTGKDVFILTVNRLSAEELRQYRSLKAGAERDQFFRRFAEQRARRADVNGVYVVLCRVPADDEPRPGLFRSLHDVLNGLLPPKAVGHAVVVAPASTEPYFPPEDQAELGTMLGEIRVVDRNQDAVLLKAVTLAGERLGQHARELGAPPPDTFRWTSVLWAAAAVAVAWGFVSVARARVAARQGTPGPVPGARQAMAAQFGTAGALWLVQACLARRTEAATPPVPQPAPEPEPEGVPDDGLHPDDRAAIAQGPSVWDHEDAEAGAGHDVT
jgi:TPM domain